MAPHLTVGCGRPVRRRRGRSHPRAALEWFDAAVEVQHTNRAAHGHTVPFLVAHGANDQQIPLAYAHRSYRQATANPKRELRVFTPEEGATEHIGLDHGPRVSG